MSYIKKTKILIRNTFYDMVVSQEKVSLKSLIEKCKINKNSFYYYYENLRELNTDILCDKVNEFIVKYHSENDIDKIILALLDFIDKERVFLKFTLEYLSAAKIKEALSNNTVFLKTSFIQKLKEKLELENQVAADDFLINILVDCLLNIMLYSTNPKNDLNLLKKLLLNHII